MLVYTVEINYTKTKTKQSVKGLLVVIKCSKPGCDYTAADEQQYFGLDQHKRYVHRGLVTKCDKHMG